MSGTTDVHEPAKRRPARRVATILAALAFALEACSSSGGSSDIPEYQSEDATDTGAAAAGPPVDLSKETYATTEQVLAAVAVAQQTEILPEAAAQQLVQLSQDSVKPGAENCYDKRETPAPPPESTYGECAFGDANGTKQMVLYGDSRAPMWASALERVAAITGWQVRLFSKDGCPVVDLQFQNNETYADDKDCDTFRSTALEEIGKLKPQLVVAVSHARHRLVNGDWPTESQWQDAWLSTLQKLAQPGTGLALLGANSNWENNDAKCPAAHSRDVQACSTEPANASCRSCHPLRFHERPDVDTVPWVCAEKCQPVIANNVVYDDPLHFTKEYTDYLSGAVAEALKPAMP